MHKDALASVVAEIPRLRRHARFLVRDAELADDLVQECLIRAIAKIGTWQLGTNMRAWLFVILHNVCVSHWRRVQRIAPTVEMSTADPMLGVPGAQERRMEMIELQKAFQRLSDDHKQILLMVVVEGLRYEDTAAALDLPVGTVRSRLSRARTALRALLDGDAGGAAETQDGAWPKLAAGFVEPPPPAPKDPRARVAGASEPIAASQSSAHLRMAPML